MGNGCGENIVNFIPDSLLLKIFQNLDFVTIGRIAVVCVRWFKVSRDELLWKKLLLRDFHLNKSLTQLSGYADDSWFKEYKRMIGTSPSCLTQTLASHCDEVLHVSFSPDGTMFCTTSKDVTVKLWISEHPCQLLCSESFYELPYRWRYSQFSQFSGDSRLLLVSGIHFGDRLNGEIAVFEIDKGNCNRKPQLRFRCRVLNKPYDIFGCWFDNSHLLTGELHTLGHLSSQSDIWLCKAAQDSHTERTAVLAPMCKFLNQNGSMVRMLLVGNYVSERVRFAAEYSIAMREKLTLPLKVDEFEEVLRTHDDIVYSSPSCTYVASCSARRCSNCERKHEVESLAFDNFSNCSSSTPLSSACTCLCHSDVPDKLLLLTTGQHTFAPHQVGIKLIKGREILSRINADLMPPERIEAINDRLRQLRETAAAAAAASQHGNMVADGHMPLYDGVIDYLNGQLDHIIEDDGNEFAPLPDWEEMQRRYDRPDLIIEVHGHVVGMSLSSDHKHLLMNVRSWPDNCTISDPWEPPPIAQQMELRVFDLEMLTMLPGGYYNHRGFTPEDNCFFIFLDSCQQFIASGSEDKSAYVWDRYHHCLLWKLQHDSVVNSVCFNPKDPEMLVSASDDYKIKVWRSRDAAKKCT